MGRWPMALEEARNSASFRVLRDQDLLWRLEGREQRISIGIYCSTEHLTVGTVRLRPGQQTAPHRHAGDESIYVVSGIIQLRLTEHRNLGWYELRPGDGFYIPEGVAHQYHNDGPANAELLFGVAPNYAEPAS
jgi:quercetin dioxygenase-like cupin family protein